MLCYQLRIRSRLCEINRAIDFFACSSLHCTCILKSAMAPLSSAVSTYTESPSRLAGVLILGTVFLWIAQVGRPCLLLRLLLT